MVAATGACRPVTSWTPHAALEASRCLVAAKSSPAVVANSKQPHRPPPCNLFRLCISSFTHSYRQSSSQDIATLHTFIITLRYIIDHGTKTHHIHRQHPRVISSEESCSFVHRKSIPMYTSMLSFHTVPFKLMLFREPTARFIKSTLVNIMLEHDSMRPIAANFLLSQPKPRSEQAT